MSKIRYINTKNLKEGDIIWNDKTDFGDNRISRHPNLIVEDVSYGMTSSSDRGKDNRIEYTSRDIIDKSGLGLQYSGKYVTNIKQNLDENEYQYYNTMKKSWITKFKNWLNK